MRGLPNKEASVYLIVHIEWYLFIILTCPLIILKPEIPLIWAKVPRVVLVPPFGNHCVRIYIGADYDDEISL